MCATNEVRQWEPEQHGGAETGGTQGDEHGQEVERHFK